MEVSEMIEVMQHYENGGEIEYISKRDGDKHWVTTTSPTWNWAYFDYRIKEPKQKVAIEKWLCRNGQGDYAIIESTNVNQYKTYEKLKLIETYEVEL